MEDRNILRISVTMTIHPVAFIINLPDCSSIIIPILIPLELHIRVRSGIGLHLAVVQLRAASLPQPPIILLAVMHQFDRVLHLAQFADALPTHGLFHFDLVLQIRIQQLLADEFVPQIYNIFE